MRESGSRTLALIGFGRLAQGFYAPILRQHGTWRVAVVADPLPAAREAAARAFPGARLVAEPEAALAASPEAVLVASPPSTHLAVWNAAAARGVRTFLEKPFVLPGQRLEAAADPRGLLTIDFNRRFWPPYQRLRAALASGRIGALERAHFRLSVPLAAWGGAAGHRLDPREGGVLADLGSQLVDLAHWMLGGLTGDLTAQVSPAQASIAVTRGDGARVRLEVAYARGASERVVLVGARQTLEMRNPNLSIRQGNRSSLRGLAGDGLAVLPRLLRPARRMTPFTLSAALGAFLRVESPPERVDRGEAEAHVALLERALEATR